LAAVVLGGPLLDPRLQRGVHLLEAGFGFRQRALDEPDEEPAEALRLNEAAVTAVKRLDREAVLAVEDPEQQEATEPAQLAIRLDGATVGWNVVARAPGGSIRTSSRAPSWSSPLIRRMKRFHSR
jgi:hypothetical protein